MPDVEPKTDVLLQTEEAACHFHCRAFTGVPAARRSWITIVSSGSDQGRQYVRELASELEAVLSASSPEVASKPEACPCNPSELDAAQYPGVRKVLVVVGSQDQPIQDQAWFDKWYSDEHDGAVMTVLPPGRYEELVVEAIHGNPDHLLNRINAARWEKKIREVLPALLARADITTASTRVFISYRRLETLPLALQLFDRLTHEGFDVFLDRFSIQFGYDFQRRLNQELEDKSMVILLESKGLKDSKWTQHEVDFAKRNRLGLLAVRMPDVSPADLMASISKRLSPAASEFDGKVTQVPTEKKGVLVDQWPPLKKDALDSVVSELKQAHAEALFSRRHRLRGDIVQALLQEGLQTKYESSGPLRITDEGKSHLLWPTTRPFEVEDFRELHTAHAASNPPAGSRALLVGPKAAQEPDRLARLEWLCTVTACVAFDEGNLAEFARRVAKGEWNEER